MKRRDFIALMSGSAFAALTRAVYAQGPGRVRRIGVLNAYPDDDPDQRGLYKAFKSKLHELGWTDGQNLRIDTRFAGKDGEQVRTSAEELVALAPEAILSTTSTTLRALFNASQKIPLVAAVVGDPIALGFTKSISHPTGNVTGFSTFNDTLSSKRLELLLEMVPTGRKAALMWVPANPQQVLLASQTGEAAKALGIELLSLPLNKADDIPPALAKAASEQAAAIIVAADPLTLVNNRAIVDGCAALGMPAMHTFVFETRNGALMSYGVDLSDNYRRAAEYIDRILRGSRIVDLPFQEPTHLTLSINLRTARAMRLTVPPSLLATADEVIE